MNKVITRCLPTALLALSLSACLDNNASNTETEELTEAVTIGVSHCCSIGDIYLDNLYKILDNEGKAEPNLTLVMERANDDQAAQLRQVDDLIAAGIQALLLTVVVDDDPDQKHHRAILDKARAAQIPVVLYVIHFNNTSFNYYDNTYFVGSLAPQSGIFQGEMIIDQWTTHPEWDKNRDGKIQYAILKGIPGNPDAEGRTKWASGTIENYPGKGIGAEQLELVVGNWRREEAHEIVTNWLKNDIGQKLEVIIANNDGMALGAIKAMKENNVKIPIFGVDAVPEALDRIKDGYMAGTILQNGSQQSKEALNLAINLAIDAPLTRNTEYKVIERELMVPYVPINIDNVDNFIQ